MDCHGTPDSVVFYGPLTQFHTYRVEKYRPVTMDDVVSHQDIISTSTLFSDPERTTRFRSRPS